ncbi:rna-directed dna polymerase from mobile element jockey-like [Willisornis vidua]|uniref:Rna-directed dna polymerase from mobile element jockey-like n=1 Tax=Willisornis vidua TaxID=1566151 RepID=A0ABQ9CKM7_9PASS|nr:rna-directed dna polymerase from mobile element jockey-like [Willisornis vidua]
MGSDEMHLRVLRELAKEVVKPLTIIFEELWQFGEVPAVCKRGNAAPIFKMGKEEDLGKYRLVTFTSVPSKITQEILWKLHEDTCEISRWVDYLVDKDLAGQSDSRTCGQWLNVQAKTSYKWCPQGSILELALFNIFAGDRGSGIECTPSKFANDTEVDMLEGRDSIQRDLDRLKRWACVNLMKYSKAKTKVLHLFQGNPKPSCRLERELIQNSHAEKNLGVLVDKNVDMT